MMRVTVGPLDVIAAALALPIIDEQLEGLQASQHWGNNKVAYEAEERLRKERAPLIERRKELLEIILTGTQDLAERFVPRRQAE